jgi:hypothetical protein
VTVDMMPTEPSILGFSNKWYREGILKATSVELPSRQQIRIFTAAFFVAAKCEAFVGRGKGDFLASRDFEDIVTILDGRENIRAELFGAPPEIKYYLKTLFQNWLKLSDFPQSIIAHLPDERRNVDGGRRVIETLGSIIGDDPKYRPGDETTDITTGEKVSIENPIRDNAGNWVGAYVVKRKNGQLLSGVLESHLTAE